MAKINRIIMRDTWLYLSDERMMFIAQAC